MKRNGSILIFVLLTFVFVSTLCLFALYVASEQVQIANKTIEKIKSQYLVESKIYKIYYDESYYKEQILPSIMSNTTIGHTIEYKLKNSDLLFEDNEVVYGRFYNHDGKRYIELKSISTYYGIKTTMIAYGTVFNDIFYGGNPALSYNTIALEEANNFNSFIGGLKEIKIDDHENTRTMEFNDYEYIKIKRRNSTYFDIYGKQYDGEEILLAEKINHYLGNSENICLIIRESSSCVPKLIFEGEVNPKGLIYVEGDLVISGNLSLNGILVINGDDGKIIIDDNITFKPIIYGAIVYNGDLCTDDWNLRYDIHNINRFGVYLPNFIQPDISVYKFE